ncbi:Pimeloyl-ACP methyl ester carboxylesterase [Rhizobium sp. NFR07]|uniref:alpha/beta fold hydrolase n=1 Tax=Rhizobium sp. NFR07 TaxID=1566262 RepID=UPI0008F239BC|nr:alpha/beta fold hydrolase [Rhizobium sp. NFR07]SFB63997.1 Pimeloyl-ACP methyl ester carboxylesterase [Rhizobium sp. NFR07]
MAHSNTSLTPLHAPMGGQIGYRTYGAEGEWLVLIHGWCGSAEQWDIIGPELARDHRVLAVSHAGFGGMAPPPPEAQTVFAMGAAVAHLLDCLDISDAILIGHSMGGPIMTEVAIAVPSRIKALIGLDTLTDRDYYGRLPDDEIRRRHEDFELDYAGRMRAMVDIIVHPSTDEALRQSITDGMIAAAPSDFALDIKDDLFAWNAEDRWPLVTRPALMLNSPWVARLAHPEPMPCFAEIEVVTFESGHFPMVEAPAMIVEKIRSCIANWVYQGSGH